MTISSSSAVPMALSTSGKWKLVRNVTITPWAVETCRYIFHRTSSRFFADFYTLCTSGNMNEYSTEKVWSLQLHLTVHMVPTWVAPKRHLDRLTHFCTAYQCAQITIMSPVVAVNGFYWSQPLFDTWLLGPIWDPPYETSWEYWMKYSLAPTDDLMTPPPSSISIGSPVFALYICMTSTQTMLRVTSAAIGPHRYVHSVHAMRPKNWKFDKLMQCRWIALQDI